MPNKKDNRRSFLKKAALGVGAVAVNPFSCKDEKGKEKQSNLNEIKKQAKKVFSPGTTNMCGFKAEPLETVRIGIIGLGMRGPSAVRRLSQIDGTQIIALCDIFPEQVAKSQKILKENNRKQAESYSGSKDVWKKVCERKDIDLIYICTPWENHTPMAVFSMEHDKHVAVEVPAAITVDECWRLVKTSEKTRKHCMMLENCCYDFFEMMTFNMVRQGVLGEVVHGEAAYIHDLRELKMLSREKGGYYDYWRLKHSMKRNGNLYPTHGLGPVAQCMNINRGDQFEYLTSLSSNQYGLGLYAKEKFPKWKEQSFTLGDMNTTMVKTHGGRSIMIQHDTTSPRPYTRIHLLSCTQGAARKWPYPPKLALDTQGYQAHGWLKDEDMKKMWKKYEHPLTIKLGEIARKIPGAHGGMDFFMDWRLIHCLRNGEPVDQDVYDAAAWSVITPLSEWSVANKAQTIDVPDFTRGAWKKNKRLEINV